MVLGKQFSDFTRISLEDRLRFKAEGEFALELVAASPTANRVYTLPDPGADATVLVTTTPQGTPGVLSRGDLAAESADLVKDIQGDLRTITGLTLTATGGAALHKIVAGAYGTGTMELRGNDTNNDTVTSTSSFLVALPHEYVAGSAVTLKVTSLTSGAELTTTRTLDAEAFLVAKDGSAGADLVSTLIQTITAIAAEYSFVITPTGLVAGNKLRVNLQNVVTSTGVDRAHISDVRLTLGSVKG
jgi:hypothetical protein